MNELEALQILITHSYFLPPLEKQRLLASMQDLQPALVTALGRLLASEKRLSLQKNTEMLAKIQQTINSLEPA